MASTSDVLYLQMIRNVATSEVVNVPLVHDPRTGKPIVLWSDIENAVENAKSLRFHGMLVPFMKDEDLLEISPRRVAPHPGIVDVIVGEDRSSEATRDIANSTDAEVDSTRTTISGGSNGRNLSISAGSTTDSHAPSSSVVFSLLSTIINTSNIRLIFGRE